MLDRKVPVRSQIDAADPPGMTHSEVDQLTYFNLLSLKAIGAIVNAQYPGPTVMQGSWLFSFIKLSASSDLDGEFPITEQS